MFRRFALPLAACLVAGPAFAQERQVLELTLDDAVRRTLENNVDIAVERFNPESSAENIRSAHGAYDVVLSSTVNKTSRTTPATNVFAGADKPQTGTWTYDLGTRQLLKSGASFRIDFANSRQSTNSTFSNFNPRYDSSFNLNLTQPLLRDFRIDSARRTLRVAKRNKEISDERFRQTVVNTVAGVKQLYYDLLYSIDNLEAQRKSLALAKKLLEENQIKVRVGTMAPLDVVAAESEVAGREESVIVAEASLAEAEDALRRTIFPKNDAETWAVQIVPRDKPKADPIDVNTERAVTTALEKRTDIAAARKNLENADLQLDFARNQTLPAVDLVAAYGSVGVGGTQFRREGGLGSPIIETIPGGYGDAVSGVFGRDFPTWTLGFNFVYPLPNRQAAAASAQARISKDQQLASLNRLELLVTQEVRSAARAVETNFKRVESTRAARVLQERRLDAEEKRFAAGMSTNFFVTQAQRDLAFAEVAELRAVADYQKSVVNFERVQEAGSGTLATGGGVR